MARHRNTTSTTNPRWAEQGRGRHRRTRRIAPAVVALSVAVVAPVGVRGLVTAASADSVAQPAAATPYDSTLMATRSGFGADDSGGFYGNVVHVTSAADSGPGSLRAAVAGDTPAWVVFDGDYTIHLSSGIDVGSNKTIDGRGHRVVLTGHGTNGLLIDNASNVIVENLILTDFGDIALTNQNNPYDAIHIAGSNNVWIDHNDLSVAGDKLVAVQGGSTDVRVSWNHFHNQEQVFQIGDQYASSTAALQTVTVDHNFFDHTGYRNPVLSYGKAHVYNNYMLGWTTYAVRSERLGQMYLERNIFQPVRNTRASLIDPGGDGCNDAHTLCDDRPGYINAVGNLLLGGAVVQTNEPQDVFVPSQAYSYVAQPATTSLASQIQQYAGWQASTPPSRHAARIQLFSPPSPGSP